MKEIDSPVAVVPDRNLNADTAQFLEADPQPAPIADSSPDDLSAESLL